MSKKNNLVKSKNKCKSYKKCVRQKHFWMGVSLLIFAAFVEVYLSKRANDLFENSLDNEVDDYVTALLKQRERR